ncbi:hypothetical protein GOV10_04435 [Candidatus Woesearchaeota archaeon]|nr:hypothetical protein [Candidatus Woesearchaeota archaeon]
MKHPLTTTVLLLALFLATQFIGLALVATVMPVTSTDDGTVVVEAPDTALGPPPETTATGGLLMILLGVTLGTVLILLLVKFKRFGLWKVWFFLAASLTMTVSFGVILGPRYYLLAGIIGFVLGGLKTWRPRPGVHNFTELFIYPGITILFYHILSVPVMLVLLALISVYDVIAVLRSKHMVSMAKFMTESQVFAGLAVPRELKMPTKKASTATGKLPKASALPQTQKRSTAILGGGDVAFPLLFAAVVMKELVAGGVTKLAAFGFASIISVFALGGLALLFFTAEKHKFYPAMPAVSAGCVIGWFIILILQVII